MKGTSLTWKCAHKEHALIGTKKQRKPNDQYTKEGTTMSISHNDAVRVATAAACRYLGRRHYHVVQKW